MTLDQTVLIWCLAVPAVISAAGCFVAKMSGQTARGLIVSACWWFAVTAAMVGGQGWQWWPEDAWRQAIWPLLAWAALIGAAATMENRNSLASIQSGRWVLAGVLAIVTAMIAMPGGEGWEDTLPLHRTWLSLIATSCLVNVFSLEQLARTGGHRWSLLVALAGLGGPMAFAAATYGSLAQWTLAMIVATSVMAGLAVFSERESGLWTAAIPATVGAAGITAAARFYSYETHPTWVYAAMLFAPTVIVGIDLLIRRQSNWLRVSVSGVAAAAIVAACVWQALLS